MIWSLKWVWKGEQEVVWRVEGRRKGLVHRQIRGLKPLEALATSGGTVLAANLSEHCEKHP